MSAGDAGDLLARIEARCDEHPARAALREADGTAISCGTLAARFRSAAAALVREGLRPGDRVLFAVRPGTDAIVTMLAVLRAGGVLVAAELGMGDEVFAARMALVKPTWVMAESFVFALSASGLARRVLRARGLSLPPLATLAGARFVRVGRRLPGVPRSLALADLTSENVPRGSGGSVPRAPADPALVVFTSGTTADPKAAVHSRASATAVVDIVGAHLRLRATDVVYSRDLHMILPALLAGAVVVFPPRGRFSAARTTSDLARHAVTHAFGTPRDFQALLAYCLAHGRKLPASLRSVLLGAAPVPRAFLQRFREVVPRTTDVHCVYGMTEMLPIAAVALDEKLAFEGSGDLVGAPLPGIRARLDPDGELHLAGGNLFSGYLGGPQVTEHATGDLASIDAGGRIVLLGRKKDMIIRGSFNVYPGLFEPTIARIEGVRACALVGLYREHAADEIVVLAIEPHDGVDADELSRRVRRAVAVGPLAIDATAQPDAIVVLAALPLAGRSGKVDKRALLGMLREKVA